MSLVILISCFIFAAAQAFAAVAHIPWTIKPLFGLISDGFPIFHLHRTYYLLGAAILGTFAWIFLGIVPLITGLSVLFMFIGNFSLAVPEVKLPRYSAPFNFISLYYT